MKKILILTLLVIATLAGYSQTPIQYLGSPKNRVEVRGQFLPDSVMWCTIRDTTGFTPPFEGAINFQPSDKTFYGYRNGSWKSFSTSIWGQISGLITNQTDLYDSLLNRQFVLVSAYGIIAGAHSATFDSATVRKVDTFYRQPGIDSFYYKINGHTYSVKDSTGGAGAGTITGAGNLSPLFNTSISGGNTITFTPIAQTANTFYGGPAVAGPSVPTFRALTIADLPIGIPNANLMNPNMSFSIGSAGTSPTWLLSPVQIGGTATLELPTASATNTGILSAGDWTTFYNKVTSVNGLTGVVVTLNADSIKKLPVDTTSNRDGYVLAFDSTNHKWYLTPGGGGGGTTYTIGALDGNGASVNGLSISGSSIYAQSASVTRPGLVNITNQSFSGNKTFASSFFLTGLTAKTPTGTDSILVRDASGQIFTGGVFPIKGNQGGTGHTTYVVGDILYANTTATLATLADVAVNNVLLSGGVGAPPLYGKVPLAAIATIPTHTLIANATGGTASPTAVPLGYGLNFIGGALVLDTLNLNDTIYANNGIQWLDPNFDTLGLGGRLARHTNISGRNFYGITYDSFPAATGRGFRVNFGSDAPWDLITRDSATGYWTRIPKGAVGEVLTMKSTGGIGWTAGGGSGGFSNPMTTLGDMIVGGASGVATRFPVADHAGMKVTSIGSGIGVEWQDTTATPSTVTASNGLTKVANNIQLFGTQTQNDTIYQAGFKFYFSNDIYLDSGSLRIGRGVTSRLGDSLNILIGNSAFSSNTTGYRNIAIGDSALKANTTGVSNTAIGYRNLVANTTGSNNVAIGKLTLLGNTTGANNIAIGPNALSFSTTANNNVAIGSGALGFSNTASSLVAIGTNALSLNTSGTNNTAIGNGAIAANTTGVDNTSIGASALGASTTGSKNTVVGAQAMLSWITGGPANTAIGRSALQGTSSSSGYGNTVVGAYSLLSITTGIGNTAMGDSTDINLTTGSYNTFIGYKAKASAVGNNSSIALGPNASAASNQFAISDSITSIKVGGMATGVGYVLKDVSGTGVLTLAAASGASADLQAVTDVGNITTNNIIVNQDGGVISVSTALDNSIARLAADITSGGQLQLHSPLDWTAIVENTIATANRILILPDESDTLATRGFVRSLVGGGSGSGDAIGRDTVQTYTSGTTLTQSASTKIIQVNPASVQSALTITTLGSAGTWHTSNDLYIVFGGTITSGNPVITSFTLTAGSGLTIVESAAFSGAINAGDVAHYHLIGTLLYRIP